MAVSLDLVTVKQTLADFRAQVAAPYSVFLAGSASPSDGYEGLYTYVASDTTSADDGFAIIVDANNHRYYRDWLSGRNSSVATAQSVGISNADTIYVATTAVTFTIARTTTLNVGWDVWIFAEGGIATISINVNDAINGGSAGTGATIPLGWSGHLSTDANGNLYLRTIPAVIGVGTITAASTTDLSTIGPEVLSITGNTGITALGTVAAGIKKWAYFTGTPTITHNATSLILPNNGSNITAAAGDIACFVSLGGGNWKCLEYQRASGQALQATTASPPLITRYTSGSGNHSAATGAQLLLAKFIGGGGGGGGGGNTGATTGGTGGTTSFNSVTAIGGSGGVNGIAGTGAGSGGAGGTGGTGSATFRADGRAGNSGSGGSGTSQNWAGAGGAGSQFAGGGGGGPANTSTGQAGSRGSGGGGGSNQNTGSYGGGGGGSGEYCELEISSPSGTYAYSVGAAGTAGSAGSSGKAGAAGGAGYIEVWEFF